MATWSDRGKKAGAFLGSAVASLVRGSFKATTTAAKKTSQAVVKARKAAAEKRKDRPRQQASKNTAPNKKAIPPSSPSNGGHYSQSRTSHSTSGQVDRRPKGNKTIPYRIRLYGLPSFSYTPHPDGLPDPGEVVWTWIPYEDNPTIGKDRPVLILARQREWLVVAQMTSKDHHTNDHHQGPSGRYWYDVGTGGWDKRKRASEVRIDRLLQVRPDDVRREGASINRETFVKVRDAIIELHG
ncbi:MAG: type II toxin-antitoxin system PemK/MazF family toxin [Actinomycetaceae bacterium]|nr:type II toxin-antitoxin system PemK/MazF family toxin [Actinomycetaceae bacterium]